MNHIATWFEIPVKDMKRAKSFYQTVLNIELKDNKMDGYQMAIFEHEEMAVSGMLILGQDYEPSKTGAVVYFNGGDDLSEPLSRVIEAGGDVVIPKTAIECGYFAQLLDSEGNRVGLYSLA
ncbi:MAG: VOC family protein [Methylococcales bacterium]|nr:VOC family protein [Methylococcales bacterium]